MDLPITFITTGILGLLFFTHTVRVIMMRDGKNISLGDGNDETMLRRVRTHGNFTEYVPFLLVSLLLLESAAVSQGLLMAYSASLILGRIIHAMGILPAGGVLWARIVGTLLTLTPLVVGSVGLLILAL